MQNYGSEAVPLDKLTALEPPPAATKGSKPTRAPSNGTGSSSAAVDTVLRAADANGGYTYRTGKSWKARCPTCRVKFSLTVRAKSC